MQQETMDLILSLHGQKRREALDWLSAEDWKELKQYALLKRQQERQGREMTLNGFAEFSVISPEKRMALSQEKEHRQQDFDACCSHLIEEIYIKQQKYLRLLRDCFEPKRYWSWLKDRMNYKSDFLEQKMSKCRRFQELKQVQDLYHQETADYDKALNYMFKLSKGKVPIDEGVICRLHALVLGNTDKENAGVYRSVQTRFPSSQTIPPAPEKVPLMMKELVRDINDQSISPIDRALEAHKRLTSVAPFKDGNRRTARLLMNLILMRNGYPPIVIRPEKKRMYLATLNRCHHPAHLDQRPYQLFMLAQLSKSLMNSLLRLNGLPHKYYLPRQKYWMREQGR